MRKIIVATLCCIPFISFDILYAHEHGNLEAHEHGKIDINVALNNNVLALELDGPAASITGFEYAPSSTADKEVATLAKQQLENPLALFAIAHNAQCTLTTTNVEGAVFGGAKEKGGHEAESGHEEKEVHRHSDIEAQYSFTCKQPDALKQLDFANFFKVFPLTKQINLQYISTEGQKGASLTSTNSQFKLNQ